MPARTRLRLVAKGKQQSALHRPWLLLLIVGRRVDLGGRPPRPPTDPDVRNSRIRFLGSRVCCARPEPVNDHRLGKRITLQEMPEVSPVETGFRVAPAEPVPPTPRHFAMESVQCKRVPGDAVVR